jgi:hypothetical protein
VSATPFAPGFAHPLSRILQALREVIASRAGLDRRLAPLVLLLWPYLNRLATRLEALARRLDNGRAAAIRPRATTPRAGSAQPRPPALPRGFAWLTTLIRETAPFRGQVQHLLANPEWAALLVDPRAGRILRPLCRMLGIAPCPELPPALFQPALFQRAPFQPRRPPAAPPPVPVGSAPYAPPEPAAPPSPSVVAPA